MRFLSKYLYVVCPFTKGYTILLFNSYKSPFSKVSKLHIKVSHDYIFSALRVARKLEMRFIDYSVRFFAVLSHRKLIFKYQRI